MQYVKQASSGIKTEKDNLHFIFKKSALTKKFIIISYYKRQIRQ